MDIFLGGLRVRDGGVWFKNRIRLRRASFGLFVLLLLLTMRRRRDDDAFDIICVKCILKRLKTN